MSTEIAGPAAPGASPEAAERITLEERGSPLRAPLRALDGAQAARLLAGVPRRLQGWT